MSEKEVVYRGNLGFVGLLTIVFVVLKAMGYLEWSWLWVFSPIWISVLLALLIVLAIIVVAVIQVFWQNYRMKRRL